MDLITMDLVPDLPGIYREDLMIKAGKEVKKPVVDAVLLTHAHADHCDYISFLHEDIPIWMGQTTQNLIRAIQDRSSGSFEREILEYKLLGSCGPTHSYPVSLKVSTDVPGPGNSGILCFNEFRIGA